MQNLKCSCSWPTRKNLKLATHYGGITAGIAFVVCRQLKVSMYGSCSCSAQHVIDTFKTYESASRSHLNLNKSSAYVMTGNHDLTSWPADLKIDDNLKIYGIVFGTNSNELNERTLLDKINKTIEFKKKNRNLTLLGRVTIVKSIALPKLWYFAHAGHTNIAQNYTKAIYRSIFQFIWNYKTELIARATVCLPRSKGGRAMDDIKLKIQIMRTKSFIYRLTQSPWWGLRGEAPYEGNAFFTNYTVILHFMTIVPFVNHIE
jgi:hypothetical protein